MGHSVPSRFFDDLQLIRRRLELFQCATLIGLTVLTKNGTADCGVDLEA